MKRPIIMKDVAKAAGVSLMTVSYALRHHPTISEATRKRIHRIARELGYRKSPYVSALMTHLRSHRELKDSPLIAYVSGYPDRRTMMANPFRRAYFEGVEERAGSQNYRLELFSIEDYSSRGGQRLSEVMRYRNVQGVIMGISPLNAAPVQLDWGCFASCVIGYRRNYPELHQIDANYFQMLYLALGRLRDLGYRRIGLLSGVFEDRRVDKAVRSALASYNHNRPPGGSIPSQILTPSRWNAKYVSAWVNRHGLDALIIQSHTLYSFLLLESHHLPRGLAVVTLEYSPTGVLSGIDQRPHAVGGAAADLIIRQINQNQRGLPKSRWTVLIDGVWIDGDTAPSCL